MKKFDLQLFAGETAQAVQGKNIVYLFRIFGETTAAVAMAFATENERSKSKDSETVATKDGGIVIPGDVETEISATAILKKGDSLVDDLEDALDNSTLVEIWEANLDEPVGEDNTKFKGRYFQGYITELTLSSSAEDHAEYECTFAVNGAGAKGEVTVSAAQQAVASYVFADTTAKTGA